MIVDSVLEVVEQRKLTEREIEADIFEVVRDIAGHKQEDIRTLVVDICEEISHRVSPDYADSTILNDIYSRLVANGDNRSSKVLSAVFESLPKIARKSEIPLAAYGDFFFSCKGSCSSALVGSSLFPAIVEVYKVNIVTFWSVFMSRYLDELSGGGSDVEIIRQNIDILRQNVQLLTKVLLEEQPQRRLLGRILNGCKDTTRAVREGGGKLVWRGLTFFADTLVARLIEQAGELETVIGGLIGDICCDLGPDFANVIVLPQILAAASIDRVLILPQEHPVFSRAGDAIFHDVVSNKQGEHGELESVLSLTLHVSEGEGLGLELKNENNNQITIVQSVVEGSAADIAGVMAEDRIISLNDRGIKRAEDVIAEKALSSEGGSILLKVSRCRVKQRIRKAIVSIIFEGVLPHLEEEDATVILKSLIINVANSTIPLLWEPSISSFTHLISTCADGDIATLALDVLVELSYPGQTPNVCFLLIEVLKKIASLVHISELDGHIVPALCALADIDGLEVQNSAITAVIDILPTTVTAKETISQLLEKKISNINNCCVIINKVVEIIPSCDNELREERILPIVLTTTAKLAAPTRTAADRFEVAQSLVKIYTCLSVVECEGGGEIQNKLLQGVQMLEVVSVLDSKLRHSLQKIKHRLQANK